PKADWATSRVFILCRASSKPFTLLHNNEPSSFASVCCVTPSRVRGIRLRGCGHRNPTRTRRGSERGSADGARDRIAEWCQRLLIKMTTRLRIADTQTGVLNHWNLLKSG